ncbi:MAG: isochorismatase family protein [Proteobacteria bacterium]|nr:isochorismatase family protein [Pseudomonadota bacterium]
MTVSTLDTQTALILVDLQKGILGLPVVHPIAGVMQNARALVDAFRRHALPIVFVNVDGGAPGRAERSFNVAGLPPDWTELAPELDVRPEDHRVTKRSWGAFTTTELHAYLQRQGVTQVVIGGVATTAGVESTARHAHELGYHVTLAIDAMTDMSAEAHENSVTRIFPRLGETGTTQEIIGLLDRRRA